MGLLFRTPDTKEIIRLLNEAFGEDRIDDLYKDDVIRGWFQDNFGGGQPKKLWQISSQLGIWPRSGDRGKGRWFKFLKALKARNSGGNPKQVEDFIKEYIYDVLNGLKNGTPNTPKSITFDTIEVAAGSEGVVKTDIMANGVPTIRHILLMTPVHPKSDKGDPRED